MCPKIASSPSAFIFLYFLENIDGRTNEVDVDDDEKQKTTVSHFLIKKRMYYT